MNCYRLFNTESWIDKNKFAVRWVGEGVACRTDKQSLIIVEPVHFAVFIVTNIFALVATRPHDKSTTRQTTINESPTVWVRVDHLGPQVDLFLRASPPPCSTATAELICLVSSGDQGVFPYKTFLTIKCLHCVLKLFVDLKIT